MSLKRPNDSESLRPDKRANVLKTIDPSPRFTTLSDRARIEQLERNLLIVRTQLAAQRKHSIDLEVKILQDRKQDIEDRKQLIEFQLQVSEVMTRQMQLERAKVGAGGLTSDTADEYSDVSSRLTCSVDEERETARLRTLEYVSAGLPERQEGPNVLKKHQGADERQSNNQQQPCLLNTTVTHVRTEAENK
ncbi:hypothetical protein LTS18_008432 [Coniosporium uncinatum]|uniref:Uncharacterized protein n=1 Tax=Coniosporium uncinatum TaxID=93489 RepID=A0ACC3DA66_9PEZI|nr:hypothetical protein LTS18_008432 [Coniosporium uncinatum]